MRIVEFRIGIEFGIEIEIEIGIETEVEICRWKRNCGGERVWCAGCGEIHELVELARRLKGGGDGGGVEEEMRFWWSRNVIGGIES